MSKWKPGQKLNNSAEAMQALLDGEKVALDFWRPECFVQLKNEKLIDEVGKSCSLEFYDSYYWHVYAPPKRKVKSERVVAIMPGSVNMDKLFWVICDSMYDAESQFPDAIAYKRVELEVEVDGNS